MKMSGIKMNIAFGLSFDDFEINKEDYDAILEIEKINNRDNHMHHMIDRVANELRPDDRRSVAAIMADYVSREIGEELRKQFQANDCHQVDTETPSDETPVTEEYVEQAPVKKAPVKKKVTNK